MKQLLWINACMRGAEQSRTYLLCQEFLNAWIEKNPGGVVQQRDLTRSELPVLTAQLDERRSSAVKAKEWDSPLLAPAQELAQADLVLVGAPYWDLSFPGALKIYLEWAAAIGVTFRYTRTGELQGMCRSEKLLYITTAGGMVQGQNFGYDYVKALGAMLGISKTQCVAAEGLDIWGNDVEATLTRAKEQLRELAQVW